MKRNCALLALAILMTSVAAHAATITTYSDQTSFSNAATGITMLDFSSTALGTYNSAGGVTVGGINIFGQDGAGYSLLAADSSTDPHYVWGTTVLKGSNSTASNSYIQLNFAGATAIAFHLASFWEGNPVKVTLSSGESFTVNTASIAPATFWGFTSDTAETFVRISTIGQNGSPVLVNFQYGAAGQSGGGGGGGDEPPADTPEVMTLLTLGAGLVALRCLKRFQATSRPAAA